MRKWITVPLWLLAPIMIVIGAVHDVLIGGVPVMGGTTFYVSYAVLTAIQVALYLYARRQKAEGVLA